MANSLVHAGGLRAFGDAVLTAGSSCRFSCVTKFRFFVFASAFLMTGCSHPAPSTPPHQTVDGLLVTLTSGDTPHTGDNTVTLTLADAATGTPVGNANISATPDMRSPVMRGVSTSGRAQGNGVYTLPVRLAVATKYQLTLHIERPGHAAAEAEFPIEAVQ